MTDDVEERLERLESLVESQQETIEAQQATIDQQRERLADLEATADGPSDQDSPVIDTSDETTEDQTGFDDRVVKRLLDRRTLTSAGLLGVAGFGTGAATARMNANAPTVQNVSPQGQVGTSSQPLKALYTRKLDGPITDDAVTNLQGDGLTVVGDALTADVVAGLELVGGKIGLDLDAIAGENLTVDTTNNELDAAGGGPSGTAYDGASAYLTTDQNTTGETKVGLDGVVFDTGSDFDNTNGSYTVPADGYYAITFKAYTDAHLVSIHVNGSERVNGEPPILTRSLQLTAGDAVTAHVDGGGTVYSGRTETYLTIDRLG